MVDMAHRVHFVRSTTAVATLAMVLAACGGAAPSIAAPPTEAAPASKTATPGETQPAMQPVATVDESSTSVSTSGAGTTLVLADSGNEAKYMVREQLAELSFPTDAVGTTGQISGAIVVSPDGSFDTQQSSITVDLASIQSDRTMRDNYIRQRVLQTAQYPLAVFVPTEARGLDENALKSGGTTFELVGNLTVHGVTKEVVWDVTASLAGNALTGTATTKFTFEDFGMTVPRVMAVLSVEDNIRLEYDFSFVVQSS
jgi:polyisoprenoid-binding protein YceI